MADSFLTSTDFQTNGINIPAGEVSVELIKDTLKIADNHAQSVLDELKQREAKHQTYLKGIHIKHEHMSNAGTMAVGGTE